MPRPPKPLVVDAHTRHHRWLDDLLTNPGYLFVAGPGVRIYYQNDKIIFEADPGSNTRRGIHFEDKIEADPSLDYPAQTVINIQATDSLVTVGIRDAANPSGPLIKSFPGLWVSRQQVPAKTIISGNEVWNLPQLPLPSPLNYDDPANFWIPWTTGSSNCPYG